MWSIDRGHFQWPLTTPDLVFKVTPFFDTEYLTNGYRYGHSYYRRRIGNRNQAFEWHQFQWHWVTSNPDFKVTILFNVKKLENGTRQSYIYSGRPIESRIWSIERRHFQWPWTTPNLVQGHAILWHWISYKRLRIRPYLLWKRIGNCTQAFKCYHFQWPSVTSNPHFKVTIVFNVK